MGWLDKLKDYAPSIVSAVLSGGATLPQLAFKALSEATGVEIKTEADAEKAVNAMSPSQMLEMKKADQSFKVEKQKLSNELAGVEIKDVQHAREANKHSVMPAIISCSMTVIAVAYGCGLFFVDLPDANRDMINNYGGQMIALWVASLVYWIGTTRSSAEKSKGFSK